MYESLSGMYWGLAVSGMAAILAVLVLAEGIERRREGGVTLLEAGVYAAILGMAMAIAAMVWTGL